jgi:lambda repressor-like predicted transcriptional regulator
MTPGTPTHSFRKWVTAEVLPAIRKTGSYAAPGAASTSLDTAQLGRLFDSLEKLVSLMPRVLGVMEQMLSAMPKMLEATHPKRAKPSRKRMHVEDVERILALRAKGYTLDELVAEAEFSQSQCWCVITGKYKVLESGRVSIDLRSNMAKAADLAAKAEQMPAQAPAQADLLSALDGVAA